MPSSSAVFLLEAAVSSELIVGFMLAVYAEATESQDSQTLPQTNLTTAKLASINKPTANLMLLVKPL